MNQRFVRTLGILLVVLLAAVPSLNAEAQISIPDRFLPGDTTINPAAGEQSSPAIAQGGNTVLVVWTDGRANTTDTSGLETADDIYGMRFDAAGAPIDVLHFPIATVQARQGQPQIAWNGANWLAQR